MRTTLDLPDDLLKQVKIAAVKRGMTLRELVAELLRQGLGRPQPSRVAKLPRIALPPDAPLRHMSIEDLKRLEADEEAGHHHAIHRRR